MNHLVKYAKIENWGPLMGTVYANSRLADEMSVLGKQHEHDKGNGSKKRPVWWHGHYSGPKNKNADSSEKALKQKTNGGGASLPFSVCS